ncbi:MAG: copper chaperone [Desulfobacteraceae bacterium]|nr:MAG: copper chaperone [Desulfobacteraceae bacterium]
MAKKTFSIPKIACGHCVMAIKNELAEMPGVHKVEGNPQGKTIEVEWDAPATEEGIRAALTDINYPAA